MNTKDFFNLDKKTCIITGGAGLLGVEHAEALSDFGANIVLADLNLDKCEERAAEIRKKGVKVLAVQLDVTSKSSWENLAAEVKKHFKSIDVLVNNAAFTNQSKSANYDARFEHFPIEDWNQIINVNLSGSFLGCQVIGQEMTDNGGAIINVASLYGIVSPNHKMYPGTGIYQPVAYSVSKAGVLALTRYVSTLWASKGIRVNSLTPGGIYDNHDDVFFNRYAQLSPLSKMADKSEMRGAVVFLASEASAHIIGHNLVVDGGWSVW